MTSRGILAGLLLAILAAAGCGDSNSLMPTWPPSAAYYPPNSATHVVQNLEEAVRYRDVAGMDSLLAPGFTAVLTPFDSSTAPDTLTRAGFLDLMRRSLSTGTEATGGLAPTSVFMYLSLDSVMVSVDPPGLSYGMYVELVLNYGPYRLYVMDGPGHLFVRRVTPDGRRWDLLRFQTTIPPWLYPAAPGRRTARPAGRLAASP